MTNHPLKQFTRITLDLQAPVARIVLNNPPVNVIGIPMMEELTAALTEVDAHPEIAILVVSGCGKGFSVGVDVGAHTPDKVHEMLAKFHGVIHALINSRKVTIASVHGNCLGGGGTGRGL